MLTVYKLDEILNVAAAILFLMVSGHIAFTYPKLYQYYFPRWGKLKALHTWVARVLLIETINSSKHEVEDHLAIWTVHAGGCGETADVNTKVGFVATRRTWRDSNIKEFTLRENESPTYWFHLCLLYPHYILQPETCSAPPAERMHSYLNTNIYS